MINKVNELEIGFRNITRYLDDYVVLLDIIFMEFPGIEDHELNSSIFNEIEIEN